MWTTILLTASVFQTPTQAADLEIKNIRTMYGQLGPTRPDAKLLPGDVYRVAFDVENVKVSDDGEVQYSMAMEVTDSKNQVQFKQDPIPLTSLNTFGGRTLPAIVHVDVGRDQPPGQYTVKITVTDRATKKTKTFTRQFDVAPPAFGIVQLNMTADYDQRIPSPPVAVPGQWLWVHFFATAFKRSGSKEEPNLAIEMQVLDEKNQPTLAKPIMGEFKDLPKGIVDVPVTFKLAPSRPGKFTVKLKATDRIANKTAELSFPITVVEPK